MTSINRREFVAIPAGVAAFQAISKTQSALADPAPAGFTELTLSEASRCIHAQEITSAQLTQALLDRIKIYNPKVNAFIPVMHDDALAQAAALDNEARGRRFRSPLHGIPITLKDNIDTAGARTTAASEVFDDRIPDEDAEVVRRLDGVPIGLMIAGSRFSEGKVLARNAYEKVTSSHTKRPTLSPDMAEPPIHRKT